LDTQIALWMLNGDSRLPSTYLQAAQDPNNRWIFHQVSLWEIQIKYDIGKLKLPKEPSVFFPEVIRAAGFFTESIEDEGIFMLNKLPSIHRDPFDRLLVSHALLHGWEIATVDSVIAQYPVRILRIF
jgi:PIN domain nuclease of toxin-antitoxin system